MPKYPRNHADFEYYVPGRKRRVAGSTKPTNDFLVMIHQQHPTATIRQIYAIITDRNTWRPNPEAMEVLEAHINAGYGDHIPDWK